MKELRVERQRAQRRVRSLPVVGSGDRDTVEKNVSNSEQINREVNDETTTYQSGDRRSSHEWTGGGDMTRTITV